MYVCMFHRFPGLSTNGKAECINRAVTAPSYSTHSQRLRKSLGIQKSMHVCMYVCMYVCMDGWMDGWMDVCMYVYIYREREI